jgi:tRNA(fMet)-specific endonuclease VapC
LRYLLDTNICVDAMSERYPRVAARIRRLSPGSIYISSIVVAELRYGADKSARPRANHAKVDDFIQDLQCLDFDLDAAATYGLIRAGLEALGKTIGSNDLLIAAQAISNQLILVTDNLGEFQRVKGLRMENWRE